MKIGQLMKYREIIAVCSEIHIEQIDAVWAEHGFVNVKPGGTFKFCKSMDHHTFQINQPSRYNNFSSLLLDVYSYVQLNMFRASSRPSSGAQQLR